MVALPVPVPSMRKCASRMRPLNSFKYSIVTSGGRDGVTDGRKRFVPVLGGGVAIPAWLRSRCSGCTRGSGGGVDPFLRAIFFFDARIRRCFEVRAGPRASARSRLVPSEAGGSPASRLPPGCPVRAQQGELGGPDSSKRKGCGIMFLIITN